MTIHSCRDLQVGTVGYATGAYHTMTALSAFLQGVLGFTHHSSAGDLAPGALTPTTINYYAGTFSNGFGGSDFTLLSSSIFTVRTGSCTIGMGAGRENWVQLSTDMVNMMSAAFPLGWPHPDQPWPTPSGGPAQSPFIGNHLIIKSGQHPLANSGIFLITSESISDNALVIDYRSPSNPPQEADLPVTCSLANLGAGFTSRGLAGTGGAWQTIRSWSGNGGGSRYHTNGAATYPRQILEAPGAMKWQLRLCMESTEDMFYGAGFGQTSNSPLQLTAIPGFSGSNGDFPAGKHVKQNGEYVYHLHTMAWHDTDSPDFQGSLPAIDQLHWPTIGVSPGGSMIRYRFFAWGDDETGTCFVALRNDIGHPADHYACFGMPEDETRPLPQLDAARLFVVGGIATLQGIDWRAGSVINEGYGGTTFTLDHDGEPISCTPSSYAYLHQASNGTSIRYDATSGISPFTKAWDIVPVDLVAGTLDCMYFPGGASTRSPRYIFEPRRMGRFPIARQGPSRGILSGTTVGLAASSSYESGYNSWYHLGNGVFLPWGVAAPIDVYGESAVSSSLAIERTTMMVNTFFTGTRYAGAGKNPVGSDGLTGTQTIFTAGDTSNTGSWFGLANTWGTTDIIYQQISASMSQSLSTGKWHFIGYSYGMTPTVTESYDRYNVQEDGRPNVNQSVGPGEWNVFPVPPPTTEVNLPPRDLTRYTKTYSSQRLQVKRIRLVRR